MSSKLELKTTNCKEVVNLRFVYLILVFIAAALVPLSALAQCAPENLLIITIQNITPGLDPDSFAAKPKTISRLGDKYGRIEEVLNEATGFHLLVVINHADAWIINKVDGSVRHQQDPNPDGVVRVPVFGQADLPDSIREFELGCELAFMKANGIEPEPVENLDQEVYVFRFEDYSIGLMVDIASQFPVYATLHLNEDVIMAQKYLKLRVLKPDTGLFVVPEELRDRAEK